ncbi:hypothetical protein A2943_02680 [Candidatus Adlerbacteria bacterium RIFCSPLOWO2_01_FULL_51_16]|uniref:Uncharacterized protein n=1 Tax=Candidatus Adlerbacteria bacterium RIFCSPLOWO2_01_FULL_51_16 TaxID=1797243 RepID=A0A1F4XI36_9BACT|nr:MAG: hypothetical protein A2943_02680 [Candidatus Adlerbacteria bacterium RIFCSPLOWO2_01_FULL_51_16]
MKNAYFLSAALFSAAFLIGSFISFAWPIPPEVWQALSNPTADSLGFISWILGVVGFVAFVMAWWQERSK